MSEVKLKIQPLVRKKTTPPDYYDTHRAQGYTLRNTLSCEHTPVWRPWPCLCWPRHISPGTLSGNPSGLAEREQKLSKREVVWSEFLSLWIYNTVVCGAMTSALRWWKNLLLTKVDKWIRCWTDSRYRTPADCLYNTDLSFQQVRQRQLLPCFNTERQTERQGDMKNKLTFLQSKPGLGQMHNQSRKYCSCETLCLKGGGRVKQSGAGSNQAIKAGEPERKNGEERTVPGSEEGSRMGDEKLLFSWSAVAEVTGGGGGGGGGAGG